MNRTLTLILVGAGLALAACGKKEEQAETPPATEPAATSEPATESPAPVPNPYANATFNDSKLKKGHAVFQNWCAPCHAPGPGHPGTQALQAKYNGATPAVLEERTDLTPDLTITFVRGGVSIMPPFRKTEITDAELDALAAYLDRPR